MRCAAAALLATTAAAAAAPAPLAVDHIDKNTVVLRAGTAGDVVALIDGRVVLSCARARAEPGCSASVQLHGRPQAVHVYSVHAPSGAVELVDTLALPAAAAPAARSAEPPSAAPPSTLPPVGILYEVWHGFTATAYANITARGGQALAVEDVLRSPNGTLMLYDVLDKWDERDSADRFFYQERPAGGYYCLYRARPGQPGLVPDCAGIPATAARHAAELTALGVDYVAVDATNLGTPSTEAEVIQVRPSEVLFEEWAALRAAGVPTPAIAGWQRAEAGGTLWQGWLELYNNASYDGLVARAPAGAPGGAGGAGGKKLLFVPSGADAGIVAQIQANGGRNDVLVVPMWANDHKGGAGEWAFMAPCTNGTTNATSGPGATYTTSVVGLGRGAGACWQQLAVGSPLGSSLTFSPSYQLMYGSVPFSSASKYEGLTYKRQWATLWELGGRALEAAAAADVGAAAPAGLPDNFFLSSWNEGISQPQPNPYPLGPAGPWVPSMGLFGDNESSQLFVDTYGTACSRDIEATDREGGDVIVNLLGSCLRVAALLYAALGELGSGGGGGGAFGALPPAALRATWGARVGAAGLASCAVAGEACCAYNETTDGYVPVWSFTGDAGGDFIATADPATVASLQTNTTGYTEVCTGLPGQTDFCHDPRVLAGITAWQGPFVLHSAGCGAVSAGVPAGVPVDPSARLPGRLPLYRCSANGGPPRWLSNDPACTFDGTGGVGVRSGTADEVLGCAADSRSSAMARPLRTCTSAMRQPRDGAIKMVRYHATDGICAPGDVDGGLLGYVR